MLGSPLLPKAVITRPGGATITIDAKGAAADAPYVHNLSIDGKPSTQLWLPESFVKTGGTLDYALSGTPDKNWGAATADAPPSFGPAGN